MNGDIPVDALRADRVWYGASTKKLFVQARDLVNGLAFDPLAEGEKGDFESQSPVVSFSPGHQGATVVCPHQDGVETWLLADMWLPGGFTPRQVGFTSQIPAGTSRPPSNPSASRFGGSAFHR